jgi:hypothetical protein
MSTMPMEQMHQRAGEQQQVDPVAGDVIPVLAKQVKAPDNGDHCKRDLERPAGDE